MNRLGPQPGERIARDRPLRFSFDGRPASGFEGDTILSALYAGGRRVFSRSFKYHRPRGELCACGQCGNSLVQVDGAPGVRACGEPAREGMRVRHQNAWPSLRFDVMRATDLFGGPFTPPGFYYKTFIRPRRLWPLYEKVLRHAAGLGRLPREAGERTWTTEYRRRHCDVLVIGGGAAGLAAALRAAELGADVVLVDEDVEPGGALLWQGGHEHARNLAARVRERGVEVLSRASALGYFDGLVPVWQGDTLHQVRAARHVAATGTIEQPLVFADNDLPGVMLAGAARRLAALYAVRPGDAAVVATAGDDGLEAALDLRGRGVEVAAVADLRPEPVARASAAGARAADAGLTVLPATTVVRAQGRNRVRGAVLAQVDDRARPVAGTERSFAAELLLVSGGSVPASSLLLQSGARARHDPATGRFVPEDLPAGVLAAGTVAGAEGAEAAERSGAVAGAEAALQLGFGDEAARRRADEDREALRDAAGPASVAVPPPTVRHRRRRRKAFVDLDEDVTAKDIAYSIAEGYDSIELSKRYTTVTMGPSQGRFSQLPSIRLMADETGRSPAEVGITTARPPWTPVPLGILAGRPFEPAKRSSIHGLHREAAANVMWAGDWRRAYDYGDPAAETLAVHRSAGLIDVSTLGKLLVQGPDAGAFLDRLYSNRFSNLKSGRIRYGVIHSDAGRIVDDGTVCRLADSAYYVTTTSSGAGAMEEWFSWWLADWQLDVKLTDVTQGLSAVNLAGPRARDIMGRVADLDCGPDAFEYLDGRRAAVAGVPALILRIGFVGELGYEIHFPAAHGEHVWQALLDAGAPEGIRPFGLEPQRILRLQKMHILVGQDTDSESTPFGAAMPWIVKLDKDEDFIGKWALEAHAERDAAGPRLVGFEGDGDQVPTEGAVVLGDGAGPSANGGAPAAAGQVTSARYSPVLQRVIGLAWVPGELAHDGARITISDDRETLTGSVVTQPFYDPEGKVLRS